MIVRISKVMKYLLFTHCADCMELPKIQDNNKILLQYKEWHSCYYILFMNLWIIQDQTTPHYFNWISNGTTHENQYG